MNERRIHGHTKSGQPITDKDIEKLAAEAEAGYDVDALIARGNKRGRPTIGTAAATGKYRDWRVAGPRIR
jgi:hypothetical protein